MVKAAKWGCDAGYIKGTRLRQTAEAPQRGDEYEGDVHVEG